MTGFKDIHASVPVSIFYLQTKRQECHDLFSKEKTESKQWFVCAFTRDTRLALVAVTLEEFWCKRDHYIYVEKADTSGLLKVSLTRQLVKILLQNLCDKSHIYCYARPQPQYLFAESKKDVLGDKELIAFWMKTLSGFGKADYVIPDGEEMMGSTLRLREASKDWKWKSTGQELAHDVIPRFPDDAKARLLKEYKGPLTFSEFWELASLSQDCKRAGFLHVESEGSAKERKGLQGEEIDKEDMLMLRSRLDGMNFSQEKGEESSKELYELLEELKAVKVDVDAVVAEVIVEKKEEVVKPVQMLVVKRKKLVENGSGEVKKVKLDS